MNSQEFSNCYIPASPYTKAISSRASQASETASQKREKRIKGYMLSPAGARAPVPFRKT